MEQRTAGTIRSLSDAQAQVAQCERSSGADHPDYAAALAELAAIEYREGKSEDALEHMNRAITILWHHGDPRTGKLFALRAPMIVAELGEPFAEVAGLPAALFQQMIDTLVELANRDDLHAPADLLLALNDLIPTVTKRGAEAVDRLPHVHAAVARVGRMVGKEGLTARLQSLEWLEQFFGERDALNRIECTLARALAHDESDQIKAARKAYGEAADAANRHGQLGIQVRVARNYGLFLAHRGHRPEARRWLESAWEGAKKTGVTRELGWSAAALGIFLYHERELERAEKLLQRAIDSLDEQDPERASAEEQLAALRKKPAQVD